MSTGQQPTTQNYLDMPDDQIMGMQEPTATPATDPVEPTVTEPNQEQQTDDTTGGQAPSSTPPTTEIPGSNAEQNPDNGDGDLPTGGNADPHADKATSKGEPGSQPNAADPVTAAKTEEQPKADGKPADEKSGEPDYKAFYDKLLTNPIRANGKDIQLRSPEEVERLIQMGLNYTKKMQAWQPRMRLVTMLENNGLLDEARLSHLIDISKGNPAAIQKLLVDTKFDPMGIDAEKAASYKPGNHHVSDTELAFNAVLDEIQSSETGQGLITEVAKQWDEQSRQAVYRDPTILKVINEQKSIGLYDRITEEMTRLSALGHLQGVPFLQAYKAVGEMLRDQGRLAPEPQKPAVTREPVATRTAAPTPPVVNSDRAKAASPTRGGSAPAKTEPNSFLDVPDDVFLRQMNGRV